MLINELARRTGVSIHTIRYYENLGFFKGVADEEVTTNNYKNYSDDLVERISLIREAKEVGFTLAEIKVLFESWADPRLKTAGKIKVFTMKIKEIDDRIAQLKRVKKKLAKTIKDIERGNC